MKKLAKFPTSALIAMILIFGFLVYANSLTNGFIWDDEEQVVKNPFIKSGKNLPAIFSGSTFSSGGAGLTGWYYRPVMSLWFMFNYSFWGLNPSGWHFFQVILHLTNSVLVFLVFKQIFKRLGQDRAKVGSFLAALIFAVHPANTESVDYIASSQEVLYSFFLLLTFWLLTKSKKPPRARQLTLPLLFLAALLSKESAIVGLPLTSVYLFLFDKKRLPSWLKTSFAALVFYLYLRLFIAKIPFGDPSLYPINQATFPQRLLTIPFEICSYLRLIFFPVILAVSQHQVVKQATDPRFLINLPAAGLFLGTITILALKSKNKLAHFSLFWFLVSLSLILNVLPLDTTIAERWLYFPLIGFLGFGLFLVLKNSKKVPTSLLVPLFLLAILLFSARTIIRNPNWKNGLTLFSHDIVRSQDAFDLENNLGVELFRVGKIKEAKPHFERSIELQPKWWTSHNNLGAVYQREGDFEKARDFYEKSIENGDYYLAYENLGQLLLITAPLSEAISFLENTVHKLPLNAHLWSTLAWAYHQNAEEEKALASARKAFNLAPTEENRHLLTTIFPNQEW